MYLASLVLLFIVYILHVYLINHEAIEEIDKFVGRHKLLYVPYVFLFLAYVGLWVYMIASFYVFIVKLYEGSDYEIVIDLVLFASLVFIAGFLASLEDSIKRL